MTTSYLDLAGFRAATIAAGEWVDEVEARYPGWIANRLAIESQRIDARLRKRYACPFAAPYPLIVVEWLTAIVTDNMMRKRGIDATDEQAETYSADRTTAEAEMKEAADSVEGLYDLPLRADTSAAGIVAPQVLGYSEASPYVAFDIQAEAARNEDANGTGTGDQ